MRLLIITVCCAFAACGSVRVSEDPAHHEGGAETPPPLLSTDANVPNNDCWWVDVDGTKLVAVWLGPRLSGEVPGGFRFVNLIYHDPAQERPVLMHSRPVGRLSGDTVSLKTTMAAFTVAPVAGKIWNDVVHRDDMVVEFAVLSAPE